ncbi:MAG: OsmC family protein [Acholeplasmataceae bacterium]
MKHIYKATATKLPEGLQVDTSSRSFKILYDEPKPMGGTDKGINPVEALLTSLGACQAIVVAAFADFHQFKYEGFHVEIEGDLDPDGFSGRNPDVRKGFTEIRYKMYFKTNESKEKTEAFADFVEKTCPVTDTLVHGVDIVRTGIVIE